MVPFWSQTAILGIGGRLPNLQSVLVEEGVYLSDMHFIFEAPCPALNTVYLRYTEGDDPIMDNIPWQQITDLRLDPHPHARSPVKLVSMCPTLKSFYLNYGIEILRDWDFTPFYGHIMSNIECLTVDIPPEPELRSAWTPLCDQTTLPQLSSLTILSNHVSVSHFRSEITNASPLLNCINRSSCPITSLTLHYRNFSNEETLRLLNLTPKLENLVVWECPVGDTSTADRVKARTVGFLKFLGVADETPHILPRLRDFTLAIKASDLDVDVLEKTIATRWIPDSQSGIDCIRSITIEFLPD
ncbi:hypothetical protein V5O48_015628, partial [Marasmius crinis-equi]